MSLKSHFYVFYIRYKTNFENKTIGGVLLQEIKIRNFYDIRICRRKKVIAHASCNFVNGEIQIRDLYVCKEFRGQGLGEVLLSKVFDYATEQQATRIIAYCGAEPFCEDGQIPMTQEMSWYEDHGFIHDHNVMGITPCMVKELQQQVML